MKERKEVLYKGSENKFPVSNEDSLQMYKATCIFRSINTTGTLGYYQPTSVAS